VSALERLAVIQPRAVIDAPEPLRALRQWVCWRHEMRDGKPTKVPHNALARIRASVGQPPTWQTFEAVHNAQQRGEYDGVGFVFSDADPYAGIDLDNCFTPEGTLRSWAVPVVELAESLDAYMERTPSGNGLHIIGRASWSGSGRNVRIKGGDKEGVEWYCRDKFFTVTGEQFGASGDVDADVQPVINMLAEMFPSVQQAVAVPVGDWVPDTEADELAAQFRQQTKAYPLLWDDEKLARIDTDTGEVLPYPGASEARQGLLAGIALWLEDKVTAERVQAIALRSPYIKAEMAARSGSREKWPRLAKMECEKAVAFAQARRAERAAAEVAFKRAEQERVRAREIGEGEERIDPLPRILTLDEMLSSAVYLNDGAMVAHRDYPLLALPFGQYRTMTAASATNVRVGKRRVEKPVADLWVKSEKRVSVDARTFAPGQPELCRDPEGRSALNLWRPMEHSTAPMWEALAEHFLAHVAYLVPNEAERERFLDWLAHIEQRPGVLPHTHWVFVTETQGIGRNWLGSVFARLWPGNVALGFDLMATLKSGFNGRLSRKLLVIVDELNEGRAGEQWEHSQKLKSLLTEEQRDINPKYGRQHVEFNCARWLMFSNHVSALPVTEKDRRLNVVRNPAEPQSADYYSRLYALLDLPGFVSAVREFLRRRDLVGFNPGERAMLNEAKQEMVFATTSEASVAAQDVAQRYIADVILNSELRRFVFGEETGEESPSERGSRAQHLKRLASEAGMRPYPKTLRIAGQAGRSVNARAWIIRNHERWMLARPTDVATEASRGRERGMRVEEI
jgi:primase-polymerase (primpol)-like protein